MEGRVSRSFPTLALVSIHSMREELRMELSGRALTYHGKSPGFDSPCLKIDKQTNKTYLAVLPQIL